MVDAGVIDRSTKERPLLVCGELVIPILRDLKTQTRRVAKLPIKVDLPCDVRGDWPVGHNTVAAAGRYTAELNQYGAVCVPAACASKAGGKMLGVKPDEFGYASPYGKPGELLWVRECFYIDHVDYLRGPLPDRRPERIDDSLYYRADGRCCEQIPECSCAEVGKVAWRPSIFMPRWACRIRLELTAVRFQRLQSITADDIRAEGFPTHVNWQTFCKCYRDKDERASQLRKLFANKWDDLNARRGFTWRSNPWVWALTFRRIEEGN